MTVSKITPVNNYTGNGSTTTFDFDFLIEAESELIVQHTNASGVQATLTLNTDYIINETGNENGSYITFPKSGSSYNTLSTGETITLSLNLDIEQEKPIKNSSKMNLSTIEWCFDYITRICQIINRKIERCIKVQEGTSIDTESLVANINIAAENIDNINAVNNNSTNINAVNSNKDNIDTIATNISSVNTVATDISNINSVAENSTNINAVNTNETNINTCATNITAIQNASTNASNAANSEAAAATSETNAANSAILADEWARKMDGKVNGEDYSAKYYANVAAQGQIQTDFDQTDNTKKDFLKNKPRIKTWTTTISTSWVGTAAPYSQEIILSGVLSTDNILIGLKPSSVSDMVVTKKEQKEISKIYAGTTANGKITLLAKSPTTQSIEVIIWESEKE